MINFLEDINVASNLLKTNASTSRVNVNNPSIVNNALNVNGRVQASTGFTVGSSGVSYTQYNNTAYIYAGNGNDINLGGGIGNIQNDVIISKGKLYISSSVNSTPSDPLHIKDVAANIRLESTSYYPNQKIDFRSSTASLAYIENNEFNQRLYVGRNTGANTEYFQTYQTLRAGGSGTHYITIGATETKLSANLTGDATEIKLQDYSCAIKVNYSQAFYVGSGGNVDIGGTSQIEKLNVAGNIFIGNNNFIKTNIPAGGSGYYTRIHGINSGNVEYIGSIDAITSGTIIGSKTNYLSLRTDESEAIRIDSNQNVGIGDSSPSYKLDVDGVIRGEQYLRLRDTAGTNQFNIRAESTYGTLDNGSKTFNYIASNHLFLVGASEKMRINSSGNVGIGTTSPQKKLHVSSGDQSTARIRLSNTNTASGGDNIELVAGVHNVTQDGFSIYNASGGGTQFVIQGGGNVGIGTDSPSEKLEVNGHIKAVDGYKGYVSDFNNGGFFHSPRTTEANPLWIPINSTGMSSSDQYYNTWVPLYAGRVRKIIIKHVSGSTPVATVCTFRKKINGVLSGTTYAGTVTGGGAAGMKVTFDFGTTNFTFNAEDEVQIGVVTGVAPQPRMGGCSCQIWYEYNIT